MKELRVGMIGYGFMGRTHSNAYKRLTDFFPVHHKPVLKAVCARNAEKARAFANNWGYERIETDWRALVEAPDIDLIDIGSPNNTHMEIALAAAANGKMVVCEKPLAMTVAEAEQMVAAVEKAGVPNMVWFNYRRVPSIALAKQIVDEGRIGRAFHYRATYLQDWTIAEDVPQGGPGLWRLDADVAGSGVTGDLLAHSIDTAIWLTGGIEKVTAITETFIKERQHNLTGKKQEVTIDDACAFLAKFDNGALATFESTRYARGRKNQNTFEINGEHGSLYFDLEDPHQLQFFDNKHESHIHGWQTILVTDFEHPYMDHYWVPGTTIGYEHTFVNATADFLKSLEAGQDPVRPNFRDALETQYVCDAVLKSGKTGVWESCKA